MGKLMLNDISYSGGGGGSSVTPNPQGTPTDTLNTIEIDSTIYDIAGSGGGGCKSYSNELIYDTYTTSNGTYSLSKSIDNYDALLICGYGYASDDPTSMIVSQYVTKAEYDKYVALIATVSGGTRRMTLNFPDSTHITISGAEGSIALKYIYGLTFGGMLAPMIYNTEEREVGVWVDNKPLYQKTFDLTSQTLTDNSWNNGILGTTGISIKSYKGYFNLGAGAIFPYEYYRNNSEFFTAVTDADSSDINVRPNMNAGTSVYAGIITIWYTKNSDVAGSGSYSSLGIPMEHYDNTEKVVGTWFGDTLYEKTFNVSSLSCTTSDYFGSYSGSLDLSGYIGSYDEVFVDLDMSYLTTSGGVKERFVLTQAIPNSTSIYLFTCASRSNVSAVLTVRYTKSTA